MWSTNKYIDITINILLFLFGINFFHYGQLMLPIICLILFVDNKYKFKVNNLKIFIVLCLFSICFCLFSYKLGIYCVMGFFLPMAYYIGSNIKEKNETNLKRIIYIIIFAIALYLLLNLIYNSYVYELEIFKHQFRYDFWLEEKVNPNVISINMTFILSIMYFLLFYEKDKLYKILGIFLLSITIIYNFILGRRTPFLIIELNIFISFLFELKNAKEKDKVIKTVFAISITLLVLLLSLVVMYKKNIGNIVHLNIFNKFRDYGLSSDRLNIFISSFEYLPKYIWGGQKISSLLDIQIHDLWFDVYDYAGIITFVLLIEYTIYQIKQIVLLKRNTNISNDIKILVIPMFVCLFVQLCLEPAMTSSSIFVISTVLIGTLVEGLNINEKN